MNRRAFLLGTAVTVVALSTGRVAGQPLISMSAYFKKNGSTEWVRQAATYSADFIDGEYWVHGDRVLMFDNFAKLLNLSPRKGDEFILDLMQIESEEVVFDRRLTNAELMQLTDPDV